MKKKTSDLKKGDLIYIYEEWREVWSVERDGDLYAVDLMGAPHTTAITHKDMQWRVREIVRKWTTTIYSDGFMWIGDVKRRRLKIESEDEG